MPNPKLPNGYSRVLNHRVDAIVDPTGKIVGHMTDTDDVYHALLQTDPLTGERALGVGDGVVRLPVLGLTPDVPALASVNRALIQAWFDGQGEVVVDVAGDVYVDAPLTIYDDTSLVLGPRTAIKNAAGARRNILRNSEWNAENKAIASLTSADGITVVATLADAGNLPQVGKAVVVLGATPYTYNGAHIVTEVTGLTFKYKLTADDAPAEGLTSPATGTITFAAANKNISLRGGAFDYNRTALTGSDNFNCHAVFLWNVKGLKIQEQVGVNTQKYVYALYGAYDADIANLGFETDSDGVHFQGHGDDISVHGVRGFTGDDMVAVGNSDYSQYLPTNYKQGDFGVVAVDGVYPSGSLTAFKYFGSALGSIRDLFIDKVAGRISGGQGLINLINDPGCVSATASTAGKVVIGDISWSQVSSKPMINVTSGMTVDSLQAGKLVMTPANTATANVLLVASGAAVNNVQIGSVSYSAPAYQNVSICINNAGRIDTLQIGKLMTKNVRYGVNHTASSSPCSTSIDSYISINCGQGYKSASNSHALYIGYAERNGYQVGNHIEATTGGFELTIPSGKGLYSNDAFGGAATSKTIRNCMGIGIDIGGTGIARAAGAMTVQKSATLRGTILDLNAVVCDATGAAGSWKQISNTANNY